MRVTKKNAFTLIELLVVIAIIAILAAILFPVFARAKEAAKKTADLSNVKQISTALQLYSGDYDDYLPQPGWSAYQTNGQNSCYSWRWAVQPYIKSVQMTGSPSNPFIKEPIWNDQCFWGGEGVTPLPNTDTMEVKNSITRSYAGNMAWAWKYQNGGFTSNPHGTPISNTASPRPAGILLIVPSRDFYPDLGPWTLTWTGGWLGNGRGVWNVIGGMTNVSYMDTHAKGVKPCTLLGNKSWTYGQEPPEDYQFEWAAGGMQPAWVDSYRAGCRNIQEYK